VAADRPKDADWLNAREREDVEAALAQEQEALAPVHNYLDALKSRNVVLLSVQYLLWSIGVYGFVFWLPTIVKAGSGQGIGLTGLISALPYALAVVLMIVNSRASDHAGRRGVFVWPWLALGAVAFYGSYLLGPNRFWLSFVLLAIAGGAMYAPYGPYFAYIPEFLPSNAAAPAIALINSFGALGGFVGSYLVGWLDARTGSTDASFLLMAVSLAVAAVLMILVRSAADTRGHPAAASPAQALPTE
jgi:nitrate/nitrite transporter NarK